MEFDSSIFKKYDIRGRYPEELKKDVIEKIAASYYEQYKPKKVLLGRDAVVGADNVENVFAEALTSLGVNVFITGVVSTPMLTFGAAYHQFEHAVMLTASHLGIHYTGFKIFINALPIKKNALQEIKRHYMSSKKNDPNYHSNSSVATVTPVNIYQAYTKKLLQILDADLELNKYFIIFDLGNGPNGTILPSILKYLKIKSSILNLNIDGKTPAHNSNPKVAENRSILKHEVLTQNADMGIIWDGDCDRFYAIDHNGEVIPPDFIAMHIGKLLVNTSNMKKMTIDVRASNALVKEMEKNNVEVIRIPAWHVPIKRIMVKDSDISFGIETSGHYVFKDFFKIDDGLLACLMFLKALQKEQKSLKQLINEFRAKYHILEEINFELKAKEDANKIIERIKLHYPNQEVSTIDGLSIDFEEWRFNIRKSKSEPLLRLNISGTNMLKVSHGLEDIKSIIKNN